MKRRARAAACLAALIAVYSAIALWWTWPLATHPGSAIAELVGISPEWAPVLFYDRLLTIAGTARNAAAIAHGSLGRLIDTGLCYPFPHPATLGEHMIELGVLAAPLRILTTDPVVLHNATLLLYFLVSALGIFAWVRFWTDSIPAAAIAGLALAVHPARLTDLAHPAVVAVHWVPVMLLFFDRLLEQGRARDAVFLTLAASLQVLTGAYPLLSSALLVGVYGSIRLVQQRRNLDRKRLILLTVAVLIAAGLASAVLVPYAHLQETWALFRPRARFFASYRELFYGSRASLGFVMPLAALVALSVAAWTAIRGSTAGNRDTRSGRRRPPVLALALAASVCLGFAAHGPLWQNGPQIPSLQNALMALVPLIGSVRVPAAVALGTVVALTALGGIGLARLFALRRFHAGIVAAIVAALLVPAETFLPVLSRFVHGSEFRTQLRPLSANEDELAAYRAFEDDGTTDAVLDLPFPVSLGRGIQMSSHYTFLAAYHDRPTAACYNSFNPPTQFNLARIAARLPSRGALDELAAVGIRDLVVHRRWAPPQLLRGLRAAAGVTVLTQNSATAALHLTPTTVTHHDRTHLEFIGITAPVVFRPAVKAKEILASFVRVRIRNNDKHVWAHPQPIRPLHARLHWYDTKSGRETQVSELKLLLPLALAAGEVDEVPLNVTPYPEPGIYRLELEIAELGLKLQAQSEVRGRH